MYFYLKFLVANVTGSKSYSKLELTNLALSGVHLLLPQEHKVDPATKNNTSLSLTYNLNSHMLVITVA